MKKIEFLEKARNIHGYKYNYIDLPGKITLNDKIEVEYNGEKYKQTVSKHLMGRCPEKNIVKKTTEEFILDAKKVWGDKYDYSLTEYTGSLNYIKVIYNGVVYEQRAKSHIEGMAPEFRKNDEFLLRELISDGDSYGNKEIEEFLKKYKLSYIKNYQTSTASFYFYLNRIRYMIEFYGRHHFEPIDSIGGLETLNKIKSYDKIKNDYCEENYINNIIIRYDQIDDIYHMLYNNFKSYIKK